MPVFPSNSALAVVYGLVLVVGLMFIGAAIISLLRSFTPGRQAATGPASHRLNRAATYAVGLGAAVCGGAGLLAVLVFHVTPAAGVIGSLAAGLIVAFVAQFVLVWLSGRDRAEEVTRAVDAGGRVARVVIPIPPNGLGEVAYYDGEEEVHLGARSSAGRAIPPDTPVFIERVTNRVAVVRPAEAKAGPSKRRTMRVRQSLPGDNDAGPEDR